ncbi:MAG: adenosylmethionine--8-amino-7-oxononanoate transaminase [Betaproteobacteria bacterium]|nr:adenosylmethionine--8-amino-7-oxononanoate transaminase [Betaproteobacteria bacterium]
MSVPTTNEAIVARSLASVWHPCTQMKHHERWPLLPIARGEGAWLYDFEGRRYLDAVSSWWVNLFGHANPRIGTALADQLGRLEHTMLAGATHLPVVELSERLAKLSGLGHAFYASDGASAVEIALKMSFHYWRNHGRPEKYRFAALEGGYHGETIGALGVTDLAIFREAYAPLLAPQIRLPFPADADQIDPAIAALETLLRERHAEIAALIVEPLVQGASGMRMYSPEYLTRARALCTQYEVHLIADEIMTGFGRTGTLFACEQAAILPDFLCLSKGITGGYLPLSCVLTTDAVYAAFYDDETSRGFLHSHSYTGSVLACRAALATLDIFAEDDVLAVNRAKAARFEAIAARLRDHAAVSRWRRCGMIWAFDYRHAGPTFAREFYLAAARRGILLRPIGASVYFMPPYIVEDEEFAFLVDGTLAVLDEMAGTT